MSVTGQIFTKVTPYRQLFKSKSNNEFRKIQQMFKPSIIIDKIVEGFGLHIRRVFYAFLYEGLI
jgi:hypothetical protein